MGTFGSISTVHVDVTKNNQAPGYIYMYMLLVMLYWGSGARPDHVGADMSGGKVAACSEWSRRVPFLQSEPSIHTFGTE